MMNADHATSTDPPLSGPGAEQPSPDEPDARSPEGQANNAPDVDELEGRLRDVEDVMAQLQSGEFDAAERSIEALEARIDDRSDQSSSDRA